jgi:hypothetical protein
MARPALVAFKEGGGLDVDAVLARLADVAVGVLVGDGHRQPVVQFLDGGVDEGGVAELGEDEQAHRGEGGVAEHRPVDHAEHVADGGGDAGAVARVGKVGLAGAGGVAHEGLAKQAAGGRFAVLPTERRGPRPKAYLSVLDRPDSFCIQRISVEESARRGFA